MKIHGRFPLAASSSCRDHQAGSRDNQNYAHDRRDLFVVVRRDAHMRVADAYAVMFGVRKRNEERNDSQHQHHHVQPASELSWVPPPTKMTAQSPKRCRKNDLKSLRPSRPLRFSFSIPRSPSRTPPGCAARFPRALLQSRAFDLPSRPCPRCRDESRECLRRTLSGTWPR